MVTLDITLETAEDTFQEDMISLQPCYPAQQCQDGNNAILPYVIVHDDLFTQSLRSYFIMYL